MTKTEFWVERKRPNETAKIPYGYKASEGDLRVLIPDPEVVPHVEQAMDHLDAGHSYREVAAWLSETTGTKISHQGIANIWRRARGDTSARTKQLAERKRQTAPKNRQQRELAALKRKEAGAKRSLTATKKKLKRLEDKNKDNSSSSSPSIKTSGEGHSSELDSNAPPEDREIIFGNI